MRIATIAARAGFLLLLAVPAEAQRSTPAGVQRLMLTSDLGSARSAAPLDTTDQREPWQPLRGIAGGVLGGVAGGFMGALAGLAAADSCRGEYCGYTSIAIGFAIGESLGVALGTHANAGGEGDVLMTSLASFGILVGGLVAMGSVGGGDFVVLVPALQIATALAMEKPKSVVPRP